MSRAPPPRSSRSAVVGDDVLIALGALIGAVVGGGLVALRSTSVRRRVDAATATALDEMAAEVSTERDARARVESALQGLPEGIVISDAGGRTVFANAPAQELIGSRHEDALVAAAVDQCLQSALDGAPGSRSVELFGPPVRVITVDARPLGDAARLTGAVAVIADESRMRRLEAVRSDFVANVSHELKTPIGGLALMAEALVDAGDPGDRQGFAARIVHEAHRVSRVVDDLLALGEIEGDAVPRREPVAVDDLVDRARADTAMVAEAAGIAVAMPEPDADLVVTGDVVQLASALGNLIENAVKYAGGATPVVVTADADDHDVRLTVSDRGIGIPRQDLDRVFERFYRVDQARSRATGGTGLGLSIVRNVVHGHGGRVTLESREGEGTTVTVHLPRRGADDPADDRSWGRA